MAEQLLTSDKKINEGKLLQMDLQKYRIEIGCILLANYKASFMQPYIINAVHTYIQSHAYNYVCTCMYILFHNS